MRRCIHVALSGLVASLLGGCPRRGPPDPVITSTVGGQSARVALGDRVDDLALGGPDDGGRD